MQLPKLVLLHGGPFEFAFGFFLLHHVAFELCSDCLDHELAIIIEDARVLGIRDESLLQEFKASDVVPVVQQ